MATLSLSLSLSDLLEFGACCGRASTRIFSQSRSLLLCTREKALEPKFSLLLSPVSHLEHSHGMKKSLCAKDGSENLFPVWLASAFFSTFALIKLEFAVELCFRWPFSCTALVAAVVKESLARAREPRNRTCASGSFSGCLY